jgi:thiamine biosynthesis lipoprotein
MTPLVQSQLATHAMGCRFELILVGASRADLTAAGEAAIEEIESAHVRLSAFDRSSAVGRINAAAGSHAVGVDGEVLGLLRVAEEVRLASGGRFDVTVGRVMEREGFARTPAAVDGSGSAAVGKLRIDADAGLVMLANASASVDLGAIGKGFAIDLAITALRDAGVEGAFVHAGSSSIAAFGLDACGEPWRVGLPGGGPRLVLDGSALGVSGTEVQGRHVIDPITGTAAAVAGPVAVSGPSAALCDAWSTAAFAAGRVPMGLPSGYTCWTTSGGLWSPHPGETTENTVDGHE